VSQQNFNDNIVNWTFENYATLASLGSGIAICLLALYIYSRSGSLIFLRDLMWRFFGGSTKFETEDYEQVRKTSGKLNTTDSSSTYPHRTWLTPNSPRNGSRKMASAIEMLHEQENI